MGGFLQGRKILILGVANKRSIAWAAAGSCAREGATLALTYQGDRMQSAVQDLAASIPGTLTFPCEATQDASLDALFSHLSRHWGTLDGLVHSIAFAPAEDIKKPFVQTSRAGFALAHDVSVYSLAALCRRAQPLFEKSPGASVVAYTYLGSQRVVPGYNLMGVAKASLESAIRYLATDLGPKHTRVNGISSGPVSTLSSRGIRGYSKIFDIINERAPMRRNIEAAEVGDATAFLLSGLARGITGEILHVDAGYHCTGV